MAERASDGEVGTGGGGSGFGPRNSGTPLNFGLASNMIGPMFWKNPVQCGKWEGRAGRATSRWEKRGVAQGGRGDCWEKIHPGHFFGILGQMDSPVSLPYLLVYSLGCSELLC